MIPAFREPAPSLPNLRRHLNSVITMGSRQGETPGQRGGRALSPLQLSSREQEVVTNLRSTCSGSKPNSEMQGPNDCHSTSVVVTDFKIDRHRLLGTTNLAVSGEVWEGW